MKKANTVLFLTFLLLFCISVIPKANAINEDIEIAFIDNIVYISAEMAQYYCDTLLPILSDEGNDTNISCFMKKVGRISTGDTLSADDSRLYIAVIGDIDKNGIISASDARKVLRIAAKMDDPADTLCLSACDFDGNGKLTTSEARRILQLAARTGDRYGLANDFAERSNIVPFEVSITGKDQFMMLSDPNLVFIGYYGNTEKGYNTIGLYKGNANDVERFFSVYDLVSADMALNN